ncbi:hypothetical protein [Phocaeicola sp.]
MMTNKYLLLFTICLLGLAGCKESAQETGMKRLLSYKTVAYTQYYGNSKELAVVLQYDEQNRVLSYKNDSIVWKYVYRTDGRIGVTGNYWKDDTEQFSGTVTLNSYGLPEVEDYCYVKVSYPEIPVPFSDKMEYTYNEKGSLITAYEVVECGDYSYTLHLLFAYGDGSKNVTRMDYDYEGFGKKENLHYEFEYQDTRNPLDFYPETTMIIPMNAGIQFTGQSGYRRDKLLDRIKVYDKEDVLLQVIECTYQYDDSGKMTECKLTKRNMGSDGKPTGEEEFFRYYDMKY